MKYHVSRLLMMPCTPVDSIKIGKSQLSIVYRYSQVVPTAVDTLQWSAIQLLIGNEWVKQTDMYLYYSKMRLYDMSDRDQWVKQMCSQFGTGPSNLFVDLICNLTDKKMQITCGDYFEMDHSRRYEQQYPDLQWEMLFEQDTIIGYVCQAANAVYAGRKWKAWYTAEIPSSAGPWKLNGLPGLILKATNDSGHKFEVMGIKQEKSPMYRYVYNSQDMKTVNRFLRYERNFHEHPYETLGNGEDVYILTLDRNGKNTRQNRDWIIPYNPIELE